MNMVAYCGLDCGACEVYLATVNQDRKAMEKTAREWQAKYGWQLTADDIVCDGCRADDGRIFVFCQECAARLCAREKKMETCAHCGEYICQRIDGLIAIVPEIGERIGEIRAGLKRE